MLELADELVAARAALQRLQALDREIAHEQAIVERGPALAAAVSDRRAQIERIARSLEEQWVDQGPLVALWQRAVELAELAEGSGADPAEYRAGVDEARLRVESARLGTRETLAGLCGEREALVDVLLAAPFDLDAPAPVRDDGRPEAGRRDALELIGACDRALAVVEEQRRNGERRLREASAERADLGDAGQIEARIAELEGDLPEVVQLPPTAPPSAVRRLQRAGLQARVDAPA